MKKKTLKYMALVVVALIIRSVCQAQIEEKTEGHGVRMVQQSGDTITLENETVKARFFLSRNSVSQEFYAKKGRQWQRVAQSLIPASPFPPEGNALFDTAVSPHRYLANSTFSRVAIAQNEDTVAVIKLMGEIRNTPIEERITLRKGQNHFHCEVSATLPDDPAQLEYLLSSFTFNLEKIPSFVHTPTLEYNEYRWDTPAQQQIIGDRSFHAPAIILQEGGLFAALVPDLNLINQYKIVSPDARRDIEIPRNQFSVPVEPDKYTMPTGMDLNVQSGLSAQPVFSFGLIDNIIQHHIRYLHPNDGSMVRTLEKNNLVYGFDLFLGADVPANAGYQQIIRFIWQRYGHPVFQTRPHLAMPFEQYVKVIEDVTFQPMEVQPGVPGYPNTGSFLAFELEGMPVGGYRSAVPGWLDALWNSEFWNNVRDASGMYYWGKQLQDTTLIDKARRTINLALLAPQNEFGLFPLIYRAETRRWQNNSYDAAHGEYALFGDCTDCDTYNVPVMSKTCAHLLEYYQKCEKDDRIIPYVSKYADWLVTTITEEGYLPSYVATDMQSSDVLMKSAQPATSLWFLAELYQVNPQPKYLKGATRIAEYLMRDIIPRQHWIDMEQYFSCGAKPLTFLGDAEQGQLARGNLSVAWAVEGFASLYRATQEEQYLKAGEKCLDYLTFTQCSWDPHFIYTAFPFGGFTVDNADHATMLDARQAEYAEPLIWYGQTLGRQDLIERGVAAGRASTVLINHPLHQKNNIYRHTNIYPFGLGPENIDHEGHPQSAMRTHPSWGEGSGVFTGLSDVSRLLEGAYIDVEREIAVGVDGVRIDSFTLQKQSLRIHLVSQLEKLAVPWNQPYETTLKIVGLDPQKKYEVLLNESVLKGLSASALQSLPIKVLPGGRIIPLVQNR